VNIRPARLPGAVLAPGSHNEGMWRAANVTVRAAAVIFVGIAIVISPWPGTADGVAQIAAFAVSAILLILWAVAEHSRAARRRVDRGLPCPTG
jgi:anti-sigma-K factor RskA